MAKLATDHIVPTVVGNHASRLLEDRALFHRRQIKAYGTPLAKSRELASRDSIAVFCRLMTELDSVDLRPVIAWTGQDYRRRPRRPCGKKPPGLCVVLRYAILRT